MNPLPKFYSLQLPRSVIENGWDVNYLGLLNLSHLESYNPDPSLSCHNSIVLCHLLQQIPVKELLEISVPVISDILHSRHISFGKYVYYILMFLSSRTSDLGTDVRNLMDLLVKFLSNEAWSGGNITPLHSTLLALALKYDDCDKVKFIASSLYVSNPNSPCFALSAPTADYPMFFYLCGSVSLRCYDWTAACRSFSTILNLPVSIQNPSFLHSVSVRFILLFLLKTRISDTLISPNLKGFKVNVLSVWRPRDLSPYLSLVQVFQRGDFASLGQLLTVLQKIAQEDKVEELLKCVLRHLRSRVLFQYFNTYKSVLINDIAAMMCIEVNEVDSLLSYLREHCQVQGISKSDLGFLHFKELALLP